MLAFPCQSEDMRAAMVSGRWLMQDRQVTTLDTATALADLRQAAGLFRARIAEIDRAAG